MRILHVTTGLENGGAEAVLYRVVAGERGGNAHAVVSLTGAGFYGERLTRVGVPVHALEIPRGRVSPSALLKLYRLIRSINPDIVQTWMYHADSAGGALARLAGKRVVWGIHNSNLDADKTSRSTRFAARVCAWLSGVVPTKIICCSEQAVDVHIGFGYRPGRMVVIHNGTDIREYAPNAQVRPTLRAEWNIDDDETLIGMVARWDAQKDHVNLIAACARLASYPLGPWRVVLVGPGMDAGNKELVDLLEKHGARAHFHLAGARNDIPVVMNALDVHVLSSSGEAFGNVTIEAMACGVPAIVTSVGAGATIVGETGWVVPPRDPERLAKAIAGAMKEMKVRDAWRAKCVAARKRVVDRFGIDGMADAYRAVWQAACSGQED